MGDQRRGDAIACAGIFVAHALIFAWVASRRIVDGDEGLSMYASELISRGAIPYRDFFYQQMPLLPYLYGGWCKLFGFSFLTGRSLSVLFSAVTAVFIFLNVRQKDMARASAIAAAALFGLCGLVWGYFPLAKTYAASAMLAVIGVYLFNRSVSTGRQRRHLGTLFASGCVVGVAINIRLYFVVALVPFVILLVLGGWRDARLLVRELLALGAGSAAMLLFALAHLLLAPWPFVYENWIYHSLRSGVGLIGGWEQKAHIVQLLMGRGSPDLHMDYVSYQFALLVALGIAGAVMTRRSSPRGRDAASGLLALVLGVTCILPTPTFTQYFCVTIPFLAMASAPVLDWAQRRSSWGRAAAALTLAVGLFGYAALARHEYVHYTTSTEETFAWRDARCEAEDHRIHTIEGVQSLIQQHSSQGDRIYASWPAYLVGTGRDSVPGTENNLV